MSTAREIGERIKNVMRNSRMAYKAQQIADELVDELVSLAQPGEGALTGWQSIDSAPKDGTQLLLVDDEGIRVVGQWGKHNHVPLYGWIRQVELYGEEVDGFDAVAWQHLPPPPGITSTPTGDSNG